MKALALVDVGYQRAPDDPASYEQLLEQARAEQEGMCFPDAPSFLAFARPHFSTRISDQALLASMREKDGELVPELTPDLYAGAMHGVETEPPLALLGALRDAGLLVLLLVAGQPASEQRAPTSKRRAGAAGRRGAALPGCGHNVLLDAADAAIHDVGDFVFQKHKAEQSPWAIASFLELKTVSIDTGDVEVVVLACLLAEQRVHAQPP